MLLPHPKIILREVIMKIKGISKSALFFLVILLTVSLNPNKLKGDELSIEEENAIKICASVIELFEAYPDSIWPGYNLAKSPFIFYYPDKWALLLNYPHEVAGFGPYPVGWPEISGNVQVHMGNYGDLAGQLAFMVEVDNIAVAAVPYWEKQPWETFAFIVHECFHQYQYDNMWDIPWEREEKYPIQDSVNTALASIEMGLLMDALKMAMADNRSKCIEHIKEFVVIRDFRWDRSDDYLRKYELGKELQEGTAKYIEIKSISLIKGLESHSMFGDSIIHLGLPQLLQKELQARFSSNSISPDDMPRNRIYPLAAIECYLLDYLGIDWKGSLPDFEQDVSYADLFRQKLDLDSSEFDRHAEQSKSRYNYPVLIKSASMQIREYARGYKQDLEEFEKSRGFRIEITLNSNGVLRSRSSDARKWLIDNGSREFRSNFRIYSLKKDGLLFQLYDSGLLEENDWDTKEKTVIFYAEAVDSIILNEEPIEVGNASNQNFDSIEMHGSNFNFEYDQSGNIKVENSGIKIDLYKVK